MGRDPMMTGIPHFSLFQFTRPHGARPRVRPAPAPGRRFNSRARMGRDGVPAHNHGLQAVSIHAPAWGATPARSLRSSRICCFNSRARMGRDAVESLGGIDWRVSIHAPAWGATFVRNGHAHFFTFQFTRPHGARHSRRDADHKPPCFNSRARMGRDLTKKA